MILEDAWDDSGSTGDDDTGPLWRAEWAGDEGTIQTGALPDGFDPQNFDDVLDRLGYAPGEIRMELVSASRWEQRTAVRGDDGRKTGEMQSSWLNAYKYKAQRNALCVNLPALYADMKASRPRKKEPVSTGRTAVVCWADIQTGKTDHLGGVTELMERLEDKRVALKAWLKSEKVDHVVIADVGDIVEGFDNVLSQTRTNGLSLMAQVDLAATEFWRTIKLCEKFGHTDVLSIPSNHCQWRRGKSLVGTPNNDWGLHISERLEQLNEEAGLDVAFHRPVGDYDESLTFKIRGTALGLAHGHQAKNPAGIIPWWKNQKHDGRLLCEVLLTGHFHYPSFRPSGRDPVTGKSSYHIQASTLDNGSAWVRNTMGEDGDPALTVFAVNDDGFDLTSFTLL
jgi:hypothetical protein